MSHLNSRYSHCHELSNLSINSPLQLIQKENESSLSSLAVNRSLIFQIVFHLARGILSPTVGYKEAKVS
jgi:hypothetical protein